MGIKKANILIFLLGVIVGFGIIFFVASFNSLHVARTLAQKQPVFGLSGVDPGRLQTEVLLLSKETRELAKRQKNVHDALLIESSLYPTHFLYSLARLEKARRAFVASGSWWDEVTYNVLLRATVWYGERDAVMFKRALAAVNQGHDRLAWTGAAGMSSDLLTLSAADAMVQRMKEVAQQYARQQKCIWASEESCPQPSGGTLPEDYAYATPTQLPLSAQEIKNLSGEADNTSKVFVLHSSVCTPVLTGPYFYIQRPLVSGTEDSDLGVQYKFLNDIYFSPIEYSPGATAAYLRDSLGVSYSMVNLTVYYVCPGVLHDIGVIHAIEAAERIARMHPELAMQERDAFLYNPLMLDEQLAKKYVSAAYAAEPSNEDIGEVSRMFLEKSAGLEDVVKYISRVIAVDVMQYDSGVPFDLSARTLFLTHSAFTSLFLNQNASAGSTQVKPFVVDEEARSTFEKTFTPFSVLQRSVSKDKLVHDIRALIEFHTIP